MWRPGGKTMAGVLVMGLLCAGCATSEVGLVAHYGFDEGKGAVAHDASGCGNDGTIHGASWAGGEYGGALSFDGTDDYVDCGAKPSLDVGKSGTVALWFKADASRQGGLVGWASGKEKPDQRFVLSLNSYTANRSRGDERFEELGVYMADGTNFYEAHSTNFRKSYFPPADEWMFFAVTFDRRAVAQYADGVLYHSRFQALNPDTSNVPLLIGKCFGMGGPSDYFKGLIDEVRIYNRPLSSREVYELYMKDARGRGKDTSAFGGIGIRAAAYPKAGRVFADLDYRGLAPAAEDLKIEGELLDAQGAVIAGARIRMLPAWGRAEAVFDVSSLPAGDYTVRAVAAKGKAGTANVRWPGRAKGWEKVKVLNNLCWELLNETPAGNRKSEYAFTNPRRGWVYFITEAEGDITLSVSGAEPATIHAAGNGGKQEAMRWLPQGEHTITVGGGGALRKLVARSVPTLTFGHYPHVGPGTGDDREFLEQHVLPHVNTILSGGKDRYCESWVRKRGGRWIQILYRPRFMKDPDKIDEYLTAQAGMSDPCLHAVVLDEFDPGNDIQAWVPSHYDKVNAAFNRILENPKYAGKMIMPYVGYNMFDYEKSAEFCKNIVNRASYLNWEVYLDQHETEEHTWVYINDGLAERIPDWERACGKAFVGNMVVVLSYLERERWNSAVDNGVFMDMQYEHLATRPEFFGLGGIEEYVSHYASEEIVRWQARLGRHYALEGNNERLSKGDFYRPGLIRNGDFIDGTDGWTIQPAMPGSVSVENVTGYGHLQLRYPYYPFTDTPLLRMKRSKTRPNVISQEVANLQPGRFYSVQVTTVDYQGLIKGKIPKRTHQVSVQMENCEEHSKWYRNASYKDSQHILAGYRGLLGFDSKNRCHINFHRRVFRAGGTTARLVISDWKNETTPGGLIGQELGLNFINVQPYFGD